MSERYQSLAHSKWDCKYHVVFVPKRRRKAILGNIRRQLGPVFHTLAQQKECQILEGHLRRTTCTSVSPYPQSIRSPRFSVADHLASGTNKQAVPDSAIHAIAFGHPSYD